MSFRSRLPPVDRHTGANGCVHGSGVRPSDLANLCALPAWTLSLVAEMARFIPRIFRIMEIGLVAASRQELMSDPDDREADHPGPRATSGRCAPHHLDLACLHAASSKVIHASAAKTASSFAPKTASFSRSQVAMSVALPIIRHMTTQPPARPVRCVPPACRVHRWRHGSPRSFLISEEVRRVCRPGILAAAAIMLPARIGLPIVVVVSSQPADHSSAGATGSYTTLFTVR